MGNGSGHPGIPIRWAAGSAFPVFRSTSTLARPVGNAKRSTHIFPTNFPRDSPKRPDLKPIHSTRASSRNARSAWSRVRLYRTPVGLLGRRERAVSALPVLKRGGPCGGVAAGTAHAIQIKGRTKVTDPADGPAPPPAPAAATNKAGPHLLSGERPEGPASALTCGFTAAGVLRSETGGPIGGPAGGPNGGPTGPRSTPAPPPGRWHPPGRVHCCPAGGRPYPAKSSPAHRYDSSRTTRSKSGASIIRPPPT